MHQPHLYKDKINNEVALNNNNHRFIFILKGQCLSSNDSKTILFFKAVEAKKYFTIKAHVFLGEFNNNFIFACEINEKQSLLLKKIGHFSNLRILAANLSVEESHIAAKAIALINWHKINKFCKKCGAKTRQYLQGQTRKCDSIKCEYQIFPRLDPAIIVLVIDQSRCLLGRPKNWPQLQFSTIAGFVEPAESLEDAVIREVFEETNIKVDNIKYHSSQPWPFPSSLMLGFTAVALSNEIKLNDNELEQAKWFSRDELTSGRIKLPPTLSISRALIDGWIRNEY
ncbi:MAG: NAD(+) diphosphatase [Woeseiaceae bacterium]|nr:NAD(+) diphosphatase [Woeseiaceae bacterium]